MSKRLFRTLLTLCCILSVFGSNAQIGVFQKVISDSVFSKDYRFRSLPNYSLYNAITNIIATSTGTYDLTTPPGTTAQRPTVPASKYILRYNTDSAALEIGNPSQVWKTLSMSSVQTFDTSSIPNFYLKVRSLLSATAPLQYNAVTGNLTIPAATSSQSGYLSQADWITFNAKLPDPGSNGLVARTSSGITASRQLVAASSNVSIVNANGVSGNPSIDLNDTLSLSQLYLPYIPPISSVADSALFLNRSTGYLEVRPIPSGGAILANVGLGYRLVKTSTGNITTVFGGYGINIDSTSNSNALTWKADTTELVTPHDLTGLNLQQVTDYGHKTTDTIIGGGLRTQHILTDTADLDDYEIDVFPDLQVESYQGADTAVLGSMFNWVVNNRVTENIKAVLQVGDLTQDATSSQFIRIDSNYDKFDAMPLPQLAYLAVPGNHDFDGGGVSGGRFFTMYNTYMGPSRFAGKTFYGNSLGGSNDNYYIKFKAGPDSILVLGLEFLPRNSTLDWAQLVLDSFPNHKVMVVTHAHVTSYGEKAMDTSRFSTNWYGLVNDNDGIDVWTKFIRQNKQIAFVFNGHYINVTTTAAQALANTNLGLPANKLITQTGLYGNTIHQIICNYQTDSLGGNGHFMRMKFKPRTGKVDISFYSAYLNRYDARFPSYTLAYPGIKMDAVVGVSGKNGGFNVGGPATFDSTVFISQIPKNRLLVAGKNGQVDTVFNDVADKVLVSNGIHEKPSFKTLTVSQIPLDSGKNILNQFTNPQTGNFWIKGKGVIGTHTNYPTVLAGLTTQFVVTTGSANWGPVSARAAGAGGGGAKWNFYTTRGTDFNNPVAVAVADALGELNWFGTANDLTGRRSMYLRGYVYGIGSTYVSSGFDFHTINTAGSDIQVMHITADGKAYIGPSLTATTNTDRLKVEGTLLVTDTVKLQNVKPPSGSYNILVHSLTADSGVNQIPVSALNIPTTYQNGITNSAGTVKLGGALTEATTISSATAANTILVSGINTSSEAAMLRVTTTGASGFAIQGESSTGRGVYGLSGSSGVGVYGQNTSSGTGVFGNNTSSGYGGQFQSSSGVGLYSISSGSHSAELFTNRSSTNTSVPILKLYRLSQSAGANNIAGTIEFNINTTSGAGISILANELTSKLTTATAGAEVSQFEISTLNGGSGTRARKLALLGNGQLILDGYGLGTFTGTPATMSAFTSTGSVIEIPVNLTGSATLDFPNTSAGTSSDLTITVTGAADGDIVSIGVPNGSTVANGCFTAWVSGANTVTIRYTNNDLVTAYNPASGTFKAAIIKH